MANVLDVAQYILQRRGTMSGKKLQKLVYYAQAWSLAWTGAALFDDRIEAWRDGPVAPTLFASHRYVADVEAIANANPRAIPHGGMDTIDSVLGFYGGRTADELIELTHSEEPWIAARRGLMPWQSGRNLISHESMRKYYSVRA